MLRDANIWEGWLEYFASILGFPKGTENLFSNFPTFFHIQRTMKNRPQHFPVLFRVLLFRKSIGEAGFVCL